MMVVLFLMSLGSLFHINFKNALAHLLNANVKRHHGAAPHYSVQDVYIDRILHFLTNTSLFSG